MTSPHVNTEPLKLICAKCGSVVSGPDHESVRATMARHLAKSGHKGTTNDDDRNG